MKVVHGLSIPLGKLGFFLPRTLSRAFTSQSREEPESFNIGDQIRSSAGGILRERRKRTSGHSTPIIHPNSAHGSTRPVYRIGGTVIRDGNGGRSEATTGPATPVEVEMGNEIERAGTPRAGQFERTIRFPDDEPVHMNSDRNS